MTDHQTIPEGLWASFSAAADANSCLTYADYSRIALYDKTYGYYRQSRLRVGKESGSDFYTSVSVGEAFPRLLAAAAAKLVAPAEPGELTLAEMGPEPDQAMFARVETPFTETRAFPLGTSLKLDSPTVLVANEILDAQPFHRLVYQSGIWREVGVKVMDGSLSEVLLPELSEPVKTHLGNALPASISEGWRLDIALDAETMLADWLAHPLVQGVILIDYGKHWNELIDATPQGTARAYRLHQQSNDLLAHPGDQDLTTHVCWDRIEAVLHNSGFTPQRLERQESFFVKHAWEAVEALSAEADSGQMDLRRQLMSLLHPGGFGAKFQVLTATRTGSLA
ncbi:MAG: SAM-dependent methyltransferase [Puniceicoccales bacterium]